MKHKLFIIKQTDPYEASTDDIIENQKFIILESVCQQSQKTMTYVSAVTIILLRKFLKQKHV